MSQNAINGTIPSTITDLPRLAGLDLSFNALTGDVPAFQSSTLEWIDLSDNEGLRLDLVGLARSSATSFTQLFCSSCSLTASLHEVAFENLQSLQYLILDHAGVTGSIPSSLALLPQLEFLSLTGNAITGSIPHEFGTMSKLSSLSLSDNALTGNVPPMPSSPLARLVLAGNDLRDDIGRLLSGLPRESLQFLDVSNNAGIGGTIPSHLGEFHQLSGFMGFSMSLTGTIPTEIETLLRLQDLQLYSNSLTGTIPRGIISLGELVTLFLHDNSIVDDMSDVVCDEKEWWGFSSDCVKKVVCPCCTDCWDIETGWMAASEVENVVLDP